MERGKSKGLADSIGDRIASGAATATGKGSTNAMEVTRERSASWQQDIAQAIIPGMLCSQSMWSAGAAGALR